MIGTDYFEGVKGIGPKKGLAIVQKSSSLRESFDLAKAVEKYDSNREELDEIERFFFEPPKPKNEPNIQFKEPDKDKIMDFMCGEHDFMIERVESALAKMSKKEEAKGQSKLEGWFGQ